MSIPPWTVRSHLRHGTLPLLGTLLIVSLSVLAPGCWLGHDWTTCSTDDDCSSVQVCDDQLCRLRDGVQICSASNDECPSGFECDESLAACVESGGADIGQDADSDVGDDTRAADQGQDTEADTRADVDDDGPNDDTATDVADETTIADTDDSGEDTTVDSAEDSEADLPEDTQEVDSSQDSEIDIGDEPDLPDASEDLEIDISPSCGDGNVDDGEECDDELDPLDDSCFDTCFDGSAGDVCSLDDHCASLTPYCGPSGCQAGIEGDLCSTASDCAASAPVCGPDGCQDGDAGDVCTLNQHCVSASLCGPAGCQTGAAGQPCANGGDCAVGASLCTPDGCSAGDEGDSCTQNDHCAATSPFCNPDGECQNGDEGDYCDNLPSVCSGSAPICGPHGFCQDGSENDACDDGADCDSEAPLCVLDGCRVELVGFVLVEPGTFTMGSPAEELGRSETYETQHQVTLTRAFYIQENEVTQTEWADFVETDPSPPYCTEDPECPVSRVNWWETLSYANSLSASEGLSSCYTLTGCNSNDVGADLECTSVTVNADDGNPYRCEGYRLPTDAEWEYAYRADTTTAFYNGDITDADCDDPNLSEIGWYCGNTEPDYDVAETGLKDANPWGLFDMAGNVEEWCWDWRAVLAASAATDPTGPTTGTSRLRRGGYAGEVASRARAAWRDGAPPNGGGVQTGFRLVRTLITD